jgi:starvation-inducible DNA-binding protein
MNRTSNAYPATKNTLPQSIRLQSVELLNRNLASAIDLERQAKQAHWNVKGPNFIALHELFDKVAEAAEEFADLLAERVTALGGTAEGRIQAVTRQSAMPPYPGDIVSGREHVDALSTALAACGTAVREAIDEAAQFGDADTADVFTEISRETDKQLWLVESHLYE